MSNETPTAPHTDAVIKYDTMTVRSIRGLEDRTIAKWEKDGWELVSQEPAKLQTQLHFRRPKSPFPWKVLSIIGGVLAVLAVIIIIGVATSSGDEEPNAEASLAVTSAPPSPSQSQSPSPSPSPSHEPS